MSGPNDPSTEGWGEWQRGRDLIREVDEERRNQAANAAYTAIVGAALQFRSLMDAVIDAHAGRPLKRHPSAEEQALYMAIVQMKIAAEPPAPNSSRLEPENASYPI